MRLQETFGLFCQLLFHCGIVYHDHQKLRKDMGPIDQLAFRPYQCIVKGPCHRHKCKSGPSRSTQFCRSLPPTILREIRENIVCQKNTYYIDRGRSLAVQRQITTASDLARDFVAHFFKVSTVIENVFFFFYFYGVFWLIIVYKQENRMIRIDSVQKGLF